MSASESDTNKYNSCALVDLVEATKFEQNSTESNKGQRQHQSGPVRSSSNDERQRAFQWLLIHVEVDKFPAYVKQNENSLTFPEKVRERNFVAYAFPDLKQTLINRCYHSGLL